MKSKYVVFAVTLLLALSSTPAMAAANGNFLKANTADTHGPRIAAFTWTTINPDASLAQALKTGTVQFAEWYLSKASYLLVKTAPGVKSEALATYNADGLVFNEARPLENDTNFRTAIYDLIDFNALATNVLQNSVLGEATPAQAPCDLYPAAVCGTSLTNSYDPTTAANLLAQVPELKVSGATFPLAANTCQSSPSTCKSLVWTNAADGTPFNPKFYIRTDDVIRLGMGTQLTAAMALIGIQTASGPQYGIDSSAAQTLIYTPAKAAVVNTGGYDAANGLNDKPAAKIDSSKAVNGQPDDWDMYEYGLSFSNSYLFISQIFNSQFIGTGFSQYSDSLNTNIDKTCNPALYDTTLASLQSDTKKCSLLLDQLHEQIPMVWESELAAINVKGWTGFAKLDSYIPGQSLGLFYTALNAQSTNPKTPTGGSLLWAEHKVVPGGGAALGVEGYDTPWLYGVDINQLIYDTPLATPPNCSTCFAVFMNWMTTSYTVTPYSGPTGTGAGWFNMQDSNVHNSANIVGGQNITFNFRNNITWTDGVPVTAYDYNFTLWSLGVSLPPSLPTENCYDAGIGAGPLGLWATYISPSKPLSISLIYNSSAFANLINSQFPVLPQHIYQWFNINNLNDQFNVVEPYSTNIAVNSGFAQGTAPAYMHALPNMLIGSGAFYFKTYDPASGSGELDNNYGYMRSAWYAGTTKTINAIAHQTKSSVCTLNPAKCTYVFNTPLTQFVYNDPAYFGGAVIGGYGGANRFGIFPGNSGYVDIGSCASSSDCKNLGIVTNSTDVIATVTVFNKAGVQVGSPITMTFTPGSGNGFTHGFYSANIPILGLKTGAYEIQAKFLYTFLGLARTQYIYSGFTIK